MVAGDAAGESKKTPPDPFSGAGEKPQKRQMKSPYQLEVLEKTYAEEAYPSEALRAELSVKIGLTDRQLQMWFCHRRLKDRKVPPVKRQRREEEISSLTPPRGAMQSEVGSSSREFSGEGRRGVSGSAMRIGHETAALAKRYYQSPSMVVAPPPQLSMVEMRIIASVEAQLGEALREDGPVLGVEFDPLPPGAFGAPIVSTPPVPKHPVRPYESKLFERHDLKKSSTFLPSMEHGFLPSSSNGKRKSSVGGIHSVHQQLGARAPQEYQFLAEQPSARSEPCDKVPKSHFYDSSVEAPSTRGPTVTSGGQLMHADQVGPSHTFHGQMSGANVLSQQSKQHIFPSVSSDYDSAHNSTSLTNPTRDNQFGSQQVMGMENPYLSSDKGIFNDEDVSRWERKRKSDEARITKEVEAHERRIRKELEKQNILRRKREEHARREMERNDRERRKEEDRMMREKQRDEERFLREQRREYERREKFLLKENQRAEKMRQKEQARREKEAARLKAANERATARKIAKEYMELIEDERLELMELAAANKKFSSIFSLDSDTLQQLDSFRDMLSLFPPSSVQLKRPFAIQPWTNSEDNIANLLMVWKFLINFADVLGLWPFTLDEFVQSLHDYDSRLLGEIHVALLKSIIKDIEDVARTPATTLGSNQSINPGGGHPRIVEGAYTWGFNIRSWQRYLNYLTWPEVLRQFALSAGLGPRLKKRNIEQSYYRDENEGNDGEDVITTLRNGSAAESAVALMQERGYTSRRRSRHRLTPGTVKFAAYHVLSLEGSKGLTILEAAEKIQKSGLRDLTTSKTPEASIAAALSRDTKLFERTAPSTYCVRSPYRKDPADADNILATALQKIQAFQSALSDSEGAEKDTEEVDEADRDEDSDGDAADEVDDELKLDDNYAFGKLKECTMSSLPGNGKGNVIFGEAGVTPQPGNAKDIVDDVVASHSTDVGLRCQDNGNAETGDAEIDESNFGEPWVQGLSEGDYCDLSVEERLNALVALIGIAIEGNSIHTILEERLEAASALKKQMWAEAQLDKRRFREEYSSRVQTSSLNGYKNGASIEEDVEEGPVDIVALDNHENMDTINNEQFFDQQGHANVSSVSAERNPLLLDLTATDTLPVQPYGYAAEKFRSQLKSYIGHRAEQLYVYRLLPLGQDRRRNRYWQFSTTASANDPGSGRIFFESRDGNWMLIDSEETFDTLLSALDTRGVRESNLHSMLQRIEPTFKEAVRRSKKSIHSSNPSGCNTKAGHLEMSSSPDCSTKFDTPSSSICGLSSDVSEYSTSFHIELGRNEVERGAALKRYQGFLKWMWKECYSTNVSCAMKYGNKRCSDVLHVCDSCFQSSLAGERHCPSCHKTFKGFQSSELVFSEHVSQCEQKIKLDPDRKVQVSDSSLPIGIRLLKAHLALMEVSIPAEALQTFWTDGYRKSWAVKLHSSSSAEELFQILTLLEGAIKRDWLSSFFETTSELLASATSGAAADNVVAFGGSLPALPWVPDTVAAVAFRLFDLDTSIYYTQKKLETDREKEIGDYIILQSRYAAAKNTQEIDSLGTPDLLQFPTEGMWLDSGSGRRGRGRGTRGRGGRGRGRGSRGLLMSGSSKRSDIRDGSMSNFERVARKYTKRGQTRGRGRGRGRRSVRPRHGSNGQFIAIKKENPLGSFNAAGSIMKGNIEDSPKSSGGKKWGFNESKRLYVEEEDDEISNGSQSDENGQASGGYEYDYQTNDYPIDDYDEDRPMRPADDDATEEEDGDDDDAGGMGGDEEAEGDEMDHNGHYHNRKSMNADEYDDEIEDDVEDAGDQEGDADEGSSSYSDYSD